MQHHPGMAGATAERTPRPLLVFSLCLNFFLLYRHSKFSLILFLYGSCFKSFVTWSHRDISIYFVLKVFRFSCFSCSVFNWLGTYFCKWWEVVILFVSLSIFIEWPSFPHQFVTSLLCLHLYLAHTCTHPSLSAVLVLWLGDLFADLSSPGSEQPETFRAQFSLRSALIFSLISCEFWKVNFTCLSLHLSSIMGIICQINGFLVRIRLNIARRANMKCDMQ